MSGVVLINPPQVFSKTQVVAGVTPPLGPAYLAAVLDREHYKVKIIDALGENPYCYTRYQNLILRGLTFQEIIKQIPKDVDLVGISNMYTFGYPMVSELAKEIKKNIRNIPIVLGGAHVSSLPYETLINPHIDYIIISEGEDSFLQLCYALNGKGDIFSIDGFGYKKNSKICINPKTNFIKNLDSIPFPLRSLLPMDNYMKVGEPHGAVRGRWTTMIATRGCPYACSFCNTPNIWLRRWRPRNPSYVVDEIADLVKSYGINDIHFEDENMTMSKSWTLEFCDELIKRNIDVNWQLSNGVRADGITREILFKMKQAGLTNLGIAPESGSERILRDVVGKQINLRDVKGVVKDAYEVGLIITCYFIIGFPDETEQEVDQTVKLVRELARLGLDECSVNTLQLVPGSELFEKMKKEEKINVGEKFFLDLGQMGDLAGVKTWSQYLSEEQISKIKRKIYLQFYLTSFLYHPTKFLRLVKNFLFSVQQTKSERVLRTLLKNFLK